MHGSQVHSCRKIGEGAACENARMEPNVDPAVAAMRRYIEQILRLTGWSLSDLARRSKVSHTTLTRFVNGEDVTWLLSSRTLAKIRTAARQEIPETQLDALWALAQRSDPP